MSLSSYPHFELSGFTACRFNNGSPAAQTPHTYVIEDYEEFQTYPNTNSIIRRGSLATIRRKITNEGENAMNKYPIPANTAIHVLK